MATCTTPFVTYTCSNATGTTCTKQAVAVYITTASTTCTAPQLALLTPAEYATYLQTVTDIATAKTDITNLRTSQTSTNTNVTNLQGQVTANGNAIAAMPDTTLLTQAVNTLSSEFQAFKAGAAAFTGQATALPTFDQLGVTGPEISFVVGWGVAAVLSLWAIGYAVGAGIGIIRKAQRKGSGLSGVLYTKTFRAVFCP